MAAAEPSTLPTQLRDERLRDMEERLVRFRRRAFSVLGLALIASGPWIGYWFLIPLAGALVAFGVANRGVRTSAHPYRWAAAGWATAPLMIAVSVVLTGAADSPALCWFALPVATLGARFDSAGVRLGVLYTVALLLLTTVAIEPATVAAYPPLLGAPLALILALAMLTDATAQSDRDHRRDAVIDPLTGLLNRSALAQRVTELEQQARVGHGGTLGVLVGDIDHFKRINDELGHQAGDAVLTQVAYEMRKALRAFDLIYRVGGEEFVVLLPGADLEAAEEVGERLRLAVAGTAADGRGVTMSWGAAISDGPLSFAATYARADAELYAAKRAGRNRTRVAV
jgi:diguanylate cyclase (GGDEF)-like protein